MKNRDTIYLVERRSIQTNYNVIVGGFPTSELAQDYADRHQQEFIDRGFEDEFSFDVVATTYYDE